VEFAAVWDGELDRAYRPVDAGSAAGGTCAGQSLTYGAVRGMLAALKDPYSRFMTPEEYKEFRSSTEGQIQGIGAILTQKEVEGAEHPQVPQDEEALRQLVEQIAKGKISVEDAVARLRAFAKGPGPGSVVVVSVIPEGPAAKKDLRAGDIITKVDGHPVTGMWLSDVVEMIKGPAGTTVTLTIQRKGVDKPIEMTITRARVARSTSRLMPSCRRPSRRSRIKG